uniref:Uncharacterized protein n=1 Tax=Salarias fasciatus TaxID=181472 RepID=A0A672JJX8_SALFA
MDIMGTSCEKQEKMWVCLEELQGDGGLGVSAYRVVPGADVQNRNSDFVHVSQRFIALPVSIPVETFTLTEDRLLKATQGAAGKQPVLMEQLGLIFPIGLDLRKSTWITMFLSISELRRNRPSVATVT